MGDLPRDQEWYPNECEFCTRDAALACEDPVCRARRYGEEECTDMRCTRVDGRCVGMHCARCGEPCGSMGHGRCQAGGS